jgi:hypothetical protein
MLLQLQLYLEDTTKGYLMQGETILYRSSSLDLAVGRAEDMLQSHSFPFGKANLCMIKDEDGNVIREVRATSSQQTH